MCCNFVVQPKVEVDVGNLAKLGRCDIDDVIPKPWTANQFQRGVPAVFSGVSDGAKTWETRNRRARKRRACPWERRGL